MLQQHIGRLHVPVQHPQLVAPVQRGQHLAAHLGGGARRQGAVLADHIGQRTAVDQLHDDPRPAVLLQHVVHGDHAGVLDPGGRGGLPLHPGVQDLHLLLGEVADGQLLDRDLTVQHPVPGPPDRAHPAAAEPLAQLVATDQQPLPLGRLRPVLRSATAPPHSPAVTRRRARCRPLGADH